MSNLDAVIELWRSGKREQALALCESLVARTENVWPVLSLLAEIYGSIGETEKAIRCLRRAQSLYPRDAATHRKLGDAELAAGANAEAVAAYRQALAIEPNNERCRNNLGLALLRLGFVDLAIECFDEALALKPDYGVARQNRMLALAAHGAAKPEPRLSPVPTRPARELSEQGFARLRGGKPDAALDLFQRALQSSPAYVEAMIGSASALLHMGLPRQALPFSEHALRLEPDSAAALVTSAATFLALKRPQDALAPSERAARIQPDLFQAHFNRAEALRALGQHEKALDAYDRTLELRPLFVAALCGRGQTCREVGDGAAARELYRRALNIEPDNAAARFGLPFSHLPMLPGMTEELDQCRQAFATELGRFNDWLAAHEDLDEPLMASMIPPFHIAYQDRSNRDLLTTCGQTYARLTARWAARREWTASPPKSACDRRIHLGIVTAHLHDHSVFRALTKGWIGQLDRTRVRISVFNLGLMEDAHTAWARQEVELIDCKELPLGQCVREIRARHMDVLLYPEVGMDLMTLQLASLRLAPHQVAAWGHPETTGLSTIDRYLSATAFEPADAQSNYSEKLLRLPNLGCYYEPYGVVGTTPDLEVLGITPNVPLLLCAGTPFKYGAEHDELLISIARRLVRCQIVLFEARPRALSAKLIARLGGKFREAGLDPERYIVMVPWQPQEAFFGLMRRATVYLDSPGFSGFNTVMQAIECELPVVAFEGRFMRSRFASGVLRQMHLHELVATNHVQFVQYVGRLVDDAEYRDHVRGLFRSAGPALYRDRNPINGLMELLAASAG